VFCISPIVETSKAGGRQKSTAFPVAISLYLYLNKTFTAMTPIEELEKKVARLRMITEAKLSYLREHARLLDQAFNELKEVHEGELDLIYDKIKELDRRMDLNGLSRN
jgi:hypothetical protein